MPSSRGRRFKEVVKPADREPRLTVGLLLTPLKNTETTRANALQQHRWCRGEGWQPPVYGIRADDWPVPGKDPVPQRARLRLASLDGELLGGGA